MLLAIGKGIELDVDVTRFTGEMHDHIVRIGLRNLLMDTHASATTKADPENYIQRSRELAETAAPKAQRLAVLNKLANEYAVAHDAALRPRATKIVELESEPEPALKAHAKPVKRK
jgi:hypothetical protein